MEINERLIISDLKKGECMTCGREHLHTRLYDFDDGVFKDCDDVRVFKVKYNCVPCRKYYEKLKTIEKKQNELEQEKTDLLFTQFSRKLNLLKNK